MKITLIDPPGVQEGLNLGLGYLAASLTEAGHRVSVLDCNNHAFSEKALLEEIRKDEPGLIGFSIKSSTSCEAERIASEIKKSFAGPLVAGGPHVTLSGEGFLKESHVFSHAILGEGEKALPRLCEAVEEGRKTSIKGLIVRDFPEEEKPVFISDLDSLPQPDYSSFTNVKETLSKLNYPVITSRGCPHNCMYCSVCLVSGRKWRTRSLENVLEEIRNAKKKYGIKKFEVIDDNFTLDIERAKKFCRALAEEKINLEWSCPNGIRTDRIDAELAALMRESGCELVMVGVESGDEKVFAGIGKGESIEDVRRGIRYLKEAGIRVGGYFIIGLPGDSLKSTRKSVEFARKNRLDVAHFNMLVPYPQTRMREWVQKNGRMLVDYRMGRHFLGKPVPVFETDDFTAGERIKAYYMANTLLRQFDFIIPPDYSPLRRILRKTGLVWDYDPRNFINYLAYGLKNRLS